MSKKIQDISSYLHIPVLRLLTCGSVDDGKSTFLERFLLDSRILYKDQLDVSQNLSRKHDPTGENPELAYLIAGPKAEIEGEITVDVSYRHFFTPNRRFIIADAQSTRNLAVAASKSDVAVLLIDAVSGLKAQTKRHLSILSLMGINRLVVAVDKMDLVGFNEMRFEKIRTQVAKAIEAIYNCQCHLWFVPISSKTGDNVVIESENMRWYDGGSVLKLLESIDVEDAEVPSFCLPVQDVALDEDKRYYAGTVISGSVSLDDEIVVLPSSVRTSVKSLTVAGETCRTAKRGDPVTIELAGGVDISRGDKLVKSEKEFMRGDTLSCQFFWFGEGALTAKDVYELKFFSRKMRATVRQIKERLDIDSLQRTPAVKLAQDEIGFGSMTLSTTHYCLPFHESKDLGSFLMVDIGTGNTVGLGIIISVEKAGHPYPYATMIDKSMRASLKNQHPMLIWFTGLSASGKSTIANLLEQRLFDQGYHTYILDGDILRNGLNKDLGFDPESRKENIRRAGELAKIMVDAGLVVLASFISPFLEDRAFVRSLFDKGEFCEVYVSTSLEVCIKRDPKGLYAMALKGEIADFTGVSSPYQPPPSPELTIDTSVYSVNEAVRVIMNYLAED